MKDFGYDVSDYCGVDPRFGTLADFDRMIARAHTLGLKVIIDQVWSHSSDAHPWFRNSRSSVRCEIFRLVHLEGRATGWHAAQ
jgi:alpha-glucosidase